MTLIKYILLFLLITGLAACNYDDEPLDPCELRIPPPSGTNVIVFKNMNGDTLQIIDFENVDVPVVVKGSVDFSDEVTIDFKYNDIYYDSDLNQSELLFNGALCFSFLSYFEKDTTDTGQYDLKNAHIWFQNGYYSAYDYMKTADATSGITNLGNVFDKIDGFIKAKFINSNNQADTLLIDCEFSVIQWCY